MVVGSDAMQRTDGREHVRGARGIRDEIETVELGFVNRGIYAALVLGGDTMLMGLKYKCIQRIPFISRW